MVIDFVSNVACFSPCCLSFFTTPVDDDSAESCVETENKPHLSSSHKTFGHLVSHPRTDEGCAILEASSSAEPDGSSDMERPFWSKAATDEDKHQFYERGHAAGCTLSLFSHVFHPCGFVMCEAALTVPGANTILFTPATSVFTYVLRLA